MSPRVLFLLMKLTLLNVNEGVAHQEEVSFNRVGPLRVQNWVGSGQVGLKTVKIRIQRKILLDKSKWTRFLCRVVSFLGWVFRVQNWVKLGWAGLVLRVKNSVFEICLLLVKKNRLASFLLTKLMTLDSKEGIAHKEKVSFSQVGPSESKFGLASK